MYQRPSARLTFDRNPFDFSFSPRLDKDHRAKPLGRTLRATGNRRRNNYDSNVDCRSVSLFVKNELFER